MSANNSPNFKADSQSEILIDKIVKEIGKKAKQDLTSISFDIDDIVYLIESIRYAYAIGSISNAIKSNKIEDCVKFCEWFNTKYNKEKA